jgi:hypothetical protein
MATEPSTLVRPKVELLGPQQQRAVTFGLCWGALVLALLTTWLYFKHWEDARATVYGAGLLTVAVLGLAVWQFAVSRAAAREPAQAEARLHGQRRPLGVALLLLAGALVLLGIWLASQRELKATFPEVSSALVLALVAAGAGILLLTQAGGGLSMEQILQGLAARRQPLMVVCFALAGVLLITGIVILSSHESFSEGFRNAFPQVAGAIMLGLVFGGAGLWLVLTAATPPSPTTMRILVLSVGGVAGLIIALMTIIRAVLWWNEVFAGGINAWRGENAWKLWLCFYVELLGLAILFGSLLLARADVRISAVLRRLLYGYNAILTGLLLLAVLVVINVTVYAYYPYTFEWTQTRGLYSLSDKSKNTLDGLKEPTTVYVMLSPGSPNYRDTRVLLQNVQAFTSRVQVEYLSPDLQIEAFRKLKERFPKLAEEKQPFDEFGGRGLLVVYGADTGKTPPPHAFIPAASLSGKQFPGQPGERKAVREFKGEDLLMTELRTLAKGGIRPVIYITQGHGELDIRGSAPGDPNGAGLLVALLQQQRYEVHGLVWGPPFAGKVGAEQMRFSQKKAEDPHVVPGDAMAVVVAQPRGNFDKGILDALDQYLKTESEQRQNKKGKLMVLSNIQVDKATLTPLDTGMQTFLKPFGVDLRNDVVLHYATGRNDNPLVNEAQPPKKSTNAIARELREYDFPVERCRTVRPEPGGGAYRAEVILEVPSKRNEQSIFWAESDLQTLRNPFAYVLSLTPPQLMAKRSQEPLPVGLAVTDRKDQATLVVFGDASMASNDAARYPQIPYYDLIISSLEWLAGRPENIGIEPRKDAFYRLRKQDVNLSRMVLLPVGLILLGLVGVGTGVWVVRRR